LGADSWLVQYGGSVTGAAVFAGDNIGLFTKRPFYPMGICEQGTGQPNQIGLVFLEDPLGQLRCCDSSGNKSPTTPIGRGLMKPPRRGQKARRLPHLSPAASCS